MEKRRIRQFSSEAAGREGGTGNVLYTYMHARSAVLPEIDLGRMRGREVVKGEAPVSSVVAIIVYYWPKGRKERGREPCSNHTLSKKSSTAGDMS